MAALIGWARGTMYQLGSRHPTVRSTFKGDDVRIIPHATEHCAQWISPHAVDEHSYWPATPAVTCHIKFSR